MTDEGLLPQRTPVPLERRSCGGLAAAQRQPFALYRTRQGFLLSNFQPGIRYCMPLASSRAPRQFSR